MKDIIDLFYHIRFTDKTPGKCKVYIDYDENQDNIYIGFAGHDDLERPIAHKKDLLWQERNINKNRRCFSAEGLSEKNAHVLEAFLIKYGDEKYGKSKYGSFTHIPHTLINKRRERKWEGLIDSTLIINGNYNSSSSRGETNYYKRS